MAKPPAGEVGHNSGLPSHEVLLAAMAQDMKALAVIKAAQDKRKTLRKQFQAKGIVLTDLDTMAKMADWSFDDVKAYVQRQMHYLGAVQTRLNDQFDLFERPETVSTEIGRQAAFLAGRMAGMAGKDCRPPANLDGKEAQSWTEGWHDGQKLLASDFFDGDGAEPEASEIPSDNDAGEAEGEAEAAPDGHQPPADNVTPIGTKKPKRGAVKQTAPAEPAADAGETY